MGKHAQKGEMQNSRKKRNKVSTATATAKPNQSKPSQAKQSSERACEEANVEKPNPCAWVRTELCQL
jgi:hypothetical protein